MVQHVDHDDVGQRIVAKRQTRGIGRAIQPAARNDVAGNRAGSEPCEAAVPRADLEIGPVHAAPSPGDVSVVPEVYFSC